MRNVEIELTNAELMVASCVGSMRRVRSIGRKNPYTTRSDWDMDIDGAAAELAVAKYLNVYWIAGVNTFKAPDVAALQVRSTKRSNGRLIVHHNDNPTALFVLVICNFPHYRLVGSILGQAAKVPEFFEDESSSGAAAWFVPQDRLMDLPMPLAVTIARSA
jgi:hypothetical protein